MDTPTDFLFLEESIAKKCNPKFGILTCLKNDNGRNITVCPNCGATLQEDEEDDYDDFVPLACRGCTNYHGDFYGYIQLICAIHPYGCDLYFCPDFVP
jgi:hypothetical protein